MRVDAAEACRHATARSPRRLRAGVTATAATRGPHEPTYRPVAGDVRAATRLLIGRADLPGYRDTRVVRTGTDVCSRYDPDLSALVTTGEVEGRYFGRETRGGALVVTSQAALFRSRDHAETYWRRAVVDPRIRPCLAEALRKGLPTGSKLMDLRTVPLRFTSGPLRIQSWNVLGRVLVDGEDVPFVMGRSR